MQAEPDIQRFLTTLEATFFPSEAEREACLNLPMQVALFDADQSIEWGEGGWCTVLLDGFACSASLTGQGKRQIVAFHIPGDVPDLHGLRQTRPNWTLSSVGPSRVGFIPHRALREIGEHHPRLYDAFWGATLINASIYREWVVNIGRREARSRLAHLLCELVERMNRAGLCQGNIYRFPVTQIAFADALGLSHIHVNRVLQELRAAKLLRWSGNHLTILNWEELKNTGDFDSSYLDISQ